MAKDKIIKPFVALVSNENKFTIPTIDDLVGRQYLAIGDVVDLQGYYEAGDGAHHKRKIEATTDGSGVQLANGTWANILIKNGELNLLHIGIEVETDYDWYDNVDFEKARRNWEKLNKITQLIDTSYMTRLFTKIIIPRGDIIIDKTLHFIRANTSGSAFSIEGFGGGHSAFGLNGSTIVCVRRENFDSEPVGVVFSGVSSSCMKNFCVTSKSSRIGRFNGVKVSVAIERDEIWKYAQLNRYDNVSFINSCLLYENDYTTEIAYTKLNNGLGPIGFYSNKQEDSIFINCIFDGGEHGSGVVGTVDNYCNIKTDVTFDEDIYSGYSSANNMFIKCHIYGGVAPIILEGCWNWNFKGYLNCYNVPSSNVLKLVGKGSNSVKIDETQIEQSHVFLGIKTDKNTGWYTKNITVSNSTFYMQSGSDVIKIYENSDTQYISSLDFSKTIIEGNFENYINDLRLERCYLKDIKFKDSESSTFKNIYNSNYGQIENLIFETFKGSFGMHDLKRKINGDKVNLTLINQGKTITENLSINQNEDGKWNFINSSNLIVKNQNGTIIYNDGTSNEGFRGFLNAYGIGRTMFCELIFYIANNNSSHFIFEMKDLQFENEKEFRYANNVTFSDGNQRTAFFRDNKLEFDNPGSVGWAKLNFVSNGALKKTETVESINVSHYEIMKKNIEIEKLLKLDTPYYSLKLQQEGIYEDFITYMDEQHEYEQLQREVETKRQEAYQLALIDNSELTYETWLSEQAEMLPIVEPVPSQALLDFKKKYLG